MALVTRATVVNDESSPFSNSSCSSACSDASIKSVDELIAFVTDKCVSCRSRAPHLAKFEVVARLHGVPEHWGSLEHIFINYCQTFCSKSSTFHDVQKYFDLLSDKDDLKRQIVEQLIAATDGLPENLADTNLEAVCASHLLPYQLLVCEEASFSTTVLNNFFALRSRS